MGIHNSIRLPLNHKAVFVSIKLGRAVYSSEFARIVVNKPIAI